jgi:hypothetical protein
MTIVFGILKDELDRLMSLKENYTRIIDDLPKGSIIVKRRNGRKYYYLAWREGAKVKYKYIGIEKSDKLNETTKSICEKKNFKEKIKNVKQSIKEIEKVLNAKK